MTPIKNDETKRNEIQKPGPPAAPHNLPDRAEHSSVPLAPRPSREALDRAENEGMIAPPPKT